MSEFDKMTDAKLNDAILQAHGWQKMPWPAVPLWQKPGAQLYAESVPNYPTLIADAWKLVKEVQADPYQQAFEMHSTPAISLRWFVDIGTHRVVADTAPRAICEAWLTWKETMK